MRQNRSTPFKKEVVMERLHGVALKTVCKKYKCWPPQVFKWLQELKDDPEIIKLSKTFEMMRSRRHRASAMTAPTEKNVLMELDATNQESSGAFFTLLHRHGGLQLLYNRQSRRFDVYDELTRLERGALSS